jgi:soluble lytic murein transglycosylase-like protein
MTIAVSEKPSLLAALLARETQGQSNVQPSGPSGSNFAGRLDTLLAGDGQNPNPNQATAQSLAESLKLQMLHSTLALAGDSPADTELSPLMSRQSSAFQSLIKAYEANQAQSGPEPFRPIPSQPLPDSEPVNAPAAASEPLSAGSQWLDPIITKASSRYGVDAGLIKAVIKAESNYNPNAVSHAGAQGLMQLMPGTARGLGVNNSFDPEQNVMAGTRFLSDLLKHYNGNLDSSLAAYNWGPGNVDKRPDRLPQETRNYLVRVKQLYSSYSA